MANLIVTVSGPVSEVHDLVIEGPLLLTVAGTYTLTFNRSAFVRIAGIAGGAGGRAGHLDSTQSRGGNGGGSGASDSVGVVSGIDANQTYTIVVGGAGIGGGSDDAAGTDGGDTTFIGNLSGIMFSLGGGKASGTAGIALIGSNNKQNGSVGGAGAVEQTATPATGGGNGTTGGGGGGGAGPSGNGSMNDSAGGGSGANESGGIGVHTHEIGTSTISATGGGSNVDAYGGGGAGGGVSIAGIKRGGGGGGGGGTNSGTAGVGGNGSIGLLLLTAEAEVTPTGPMMGGGITRGSRTRQYMAMAMPINAPTQPVITPEYVPRPEFPVRAKYVQQPTNASIVPQHNPAEGSALDWRGYEPEWIARRIAQQPASLVWSTVTPAVQPIDTYGWRGSYPEWIAKSKQAYMDPFRWNPSTPVVVAAPTGIAAVIAKQPDYIRSKIELSGAHAPHLFSAPGTPNAPPPTGIAALFSHRPDYIRSKIELSAAHAPFYFSGQVPPGTVQTGVGVIFIGDASVLDRPIVIQYQALTGPVMRVVTRQAWATVYPDRLYRKGRRAQYAPYFGGFGIPGTQLTTAATEPIFPSRIDKRANIAWMPWNQFGPDPATIPAPPTPDISTWVGYGPDQISRRYLPTALHPSYTSGIVPAVFTIPTLSWGPTYPDAISRRSFIAALQQTLANTFGQQGATQPDAAWRGVYPDYIWAPRRVRQQEWQSWIPGHEFDVPELAWEPSFPDKLWGRSFHASLQHGRTEPFSPIYPVTPFPIPIRPDWIARRTFSAANQLSFVIARDREVAPELSWKGYYPDWLARLVSPRWFTNVEPNAVAIAAAPTLAWEPQYPDWIARRSYLTALQPFFTLGSWGTISQPELSWQGSYPSQFLRPRGLNPFLQDWNALDVFPIPNPPSPDSAWIPRYPDFARRTLLHVSQLQYNFQHPTVNPPAPFSWNYPAVIPPRRVRRPEGQSVEGQPGTAITPSAWNPEFPDRINPKRQIIRPSVVQAPPSTQLSIPTLEWRPRFPDRFWRVANATNPFFLFRPPTFDPKVDCIAFTHETSWFSCMVAQVVTFTSFTHESCTQSGPTGEEHC